jgi:hypothetical protein
MAEHIRNLGDRTVSMLHEQFQINASVVSVARVGDSGGTLVRLTADESDAPGFTARAWLAVGSLLPLCTCAMGVDEVTGQHHAQILVPSPAEEWRLAFDTAAAEPWATRMRSTTDVLVLVALAGFALSLGAAAI